ncbi:unnamed protein product [Moneuplotes crassus]|uniref:Uncharacterized protein n=1 Tax=Euplotes crassus TaxID=5936 RepID=A0AAD1U0L6_EUPCR|nr:unnamed protein product [Moneuplotes crassus]
MISSYQVCFITYFPSSVIDSRTMIKAKMENSACRVFPTLEKNDIIRINVGKFCEYQNERMYIEVQSLDKICQTQEKIVKRLHGLVDYTKGGRRHSINPISKFRRESENRSAERNMSIYTNIYKKLSKTPEVSQERKNIHKKQAKSTHHIDLTLLKSKSIKLAKDKLAANQNDVESPSKELPQFTSSLPLLRKTYKSNISVGATCTLPQPIRNSESSQKDSKYLKEDSRPHISEEMQAKGEGDTPKFQKQLLFGSRLRNGSVQLLNSKEYNKILQPHNRNMSLDESSSIVDDFKIAKSIDSVQGNDDCNSITEKYNSIKGVNVMTTVDLSRRNHSCSPKQGISIERSIFEPNNDNIELTNNFEEDKEKSDYFGDTTKKSAQPACNHNPHMKILEETSMNRKPSKSKKKKRKSRQHTRYLSKQMLGNRTKRSKSNSRSDISQECSPLRGSKYYNCRFKGISSISTYIGCTIHEYKLPRDGRCKKCKGFAIHKSKFYKGKFVIQHVKTNRYLKCIAFGVIAKLIGIKPEDYEPSMLMDIRDKLITEKENNCSKPYYCLKLIQPLADKEEYIIANVKN